MEKKKSAVKLISIIFCIITIAVLIMLIAVKTYTGGQIKTINNIYAAVVHNIYDDYKACFAEGSKYLSQSEFDALYADYEKQWGEDFKISADFSTREKLENGKYAVTVKVTVYNDTDSSTENCTFTMIKQHGKWVAAE